MKNVVVWQAKTELNGTQTTRYVVTSGYYEDDARFVLEARYPRETVLGVETLDEGIYYDK